MNKLGVRRETKQHIFLEFTHASKFRCIKCPTQYSLSTMIVICSFGVPFVCTNDSVYILCVINFQVHISKPLSIDLLFL